MFWEGGDVTAWVYFSLGSAGVSDVAPSNFKVFIPTNEIAGSKTSGDKLISINFFMPAGMWKKGYLTNLLGFIFLLREHIRDTNDHKKLSHLRKYW